MVVECHALLAGALGKPTIVVLSRPAAWQWLVDRDDSPWYPTARLFRQDATRDWAAVLQRVAGALDELLPARETGNHPPGNDIQVIFPASFASAKAVYPMPA